MTSWHKTGAHPFYIGMYIHIYTHIYVHKYTSQKECLHIFWVGCLKAMWIASSKTSNVLTNMVSTCKYQVKYAVRRDLETPTNCQSFNWNPVVINNGHSCVFRVWLQWLGTKKTMRCLIPWGPRNPFTSLHLQWSNNPSCMSPINT